jgi:hypothetical protein
MPSHASRSLLTSHWLDGLAIALSDYIDARSIPLLGQLCGDSQALQLKYNLTDEH